MLQLFQPWGPLLLSTFEYDATLRCRTCKIQTCEELGCLLVRTGSRWKLWRERLLPARLLALKTTPSTHRALEPSLI